MSSIIGNFKYNNPIGTFQWENSAEAGALRRKVEKFVAKNPISNQTWHNYAELKELRELGRAISTEGALDSKSLAIRDSSSTKEELEYDKLWNEFYDSVNPDGSSKFGLARVVEQMVLQIDPWA